MRIPTSVIVMSLLTAAPFGLAIRDTLNQKDVVVDEDDPYSLEYDGRRARRDRRALEEYEREVAREAEERARARERRLAKLDELYGSQPASMGALFAGIYLGADAGSFQPEPARERIYRASRDGFISVSFDVDEKALRAVTVEVEGRDYDPDLEQVVDACATLYDRLVERWGRAAGGIWRDPATHQRASLDQDTCTLRFDRYLDATEWFGALPLDLVGQSVAKLLVRVGDDAIVDDELVEWTLPGLGAGSEDTQLQAFVHNKKVIGLRVVTDSDFDSLLGVRELLSKKLKAQPKQDDDNDGAWTWKGKLPVTIEHSYGSNEFTLHAGKSWE